MKQHFENEMKCYAKLFSLEEKIEDIGFDLFSKQLLIAKKKDSKMENEINILMIQLNAIKQEKAKIIEKLHNEEKERELCTREMQKELIKGPRSTASEVKNIFDNYILNLKNADLSRKAKYANFQIRQRENYIRHLREELSLRNQLIRERIKSRQQIAIIDEEENYSKMTQFESNKSYDQASNKTEIFPLSVVEKTQKNRNILHREMIHRMGSGNLVSNARSGNNLHLYALRARRRNIINWNSKNNNEENSLSEETRGNRSNGRIPILKSKKPSKGTHHVFSPSQGKFTVQSNKNHHNVTLSISLAQNQ